MKLNKIFLVFLLALFAGCSEERAGGGENKGDNADANIVSVEEDAIPDIKIEEDIDITEPDDIKEETLSDECRSEEWYFCPPLDAIWQVKITKNICVDPPIIIKMGECEQKFECDPSSQEIIREECEDKYGITGFKNTWCYKGTYVSDECMPCLPEICNGLDDDCDNQVDEDLEAGICMHDCGIGDLVCVGGEEICIPPLPEEEICDYKDNDCDGEIDEGQRNDCDECGLVPEEICDGVDNDCDGLTDENLTKICETDCETNYSYCIAGEWNCTALPPSDEVCDYVDNDCDGEVDEGLDCECTFFGILLPCTNAPLICGAGYRTCVCTETKLNWLGEEDCLKSEVTECVSYCWAMGFKYPGCKKTVGEPVEEVCNNWDDDCDNKIDEYLYKECYTGDEETLDVGICHAGDMICHEGKWGQSPDKQVNPSNFVQGYCKDEQTPKDKDSCNGTDDNCDGIIDDGKIMENTDILFVIDVSGSMDLKIKAVLNALTMFANYYSDEKVIQWGAIIGPMPGTQCAVFDLNNNCFNYDEFLLLYSNLSPFSQFMADFNALKSTTGANMSTGSEMLYDALYLAAYDLSFAPPLDISAISWKTSNTISSVFSIPTIDQFIINWREDVHHAIIIFTDEPGVSYMDPKIDINHLTSLITNSDDLVTYVFTTSSYGVKGDWEPLALNGGTWFPLGADPNIIYTNLMQILDETACQ